MKKTTPKIGIIGAMEVEISLLTQALDQSGSIRKQTFAGMTFHEGRIGSTDVVVVRSGVGKVNAAICVQILADRFHVTHLLNTGVAGSLDNRLDIGDLAVSTEAVHHDVDATVFGYQPGEIPQLGTTAFPADPFLRKAAAAACRKAAPDIKLLEGRVVSGDQFISSRARKEEIKSVFGGLCTEMEGAAIAQAAWLNGLPFVILRAISDKADDSVSVSYDQFESKAARDCAGIVLFLLKSIV